MKKNILAIATSIFLSACGGGSIDYPTSPMAGRVVTLPTDHIESFQGYITQSTLPLTGKVKVRAHVRLDYPPGTKLTTADGPGIPTLTLYFERQGDDYSAKGPFEAYRWYATFAPVRLTAPGEYVVEARFDQNWTAVLTSSRQNNPQGYADALQNAARIGFVLGGGGGAGHGILANGPATITVLSFTVE